MTTTETYTRDELDRAIYRAFRMGFANSLAELDGDLQPHHHGRRRRCCTPCRVLDTAAAKLRDSRYPFSEPPTWKDAPDGRGTRAIRGHEPGGAPPVAPQSRGPGRTQQPPHHPSRRLLDVTAALGPLGAIAGRLWRSLEFSARPLGSVTRRGDGAETGSWARCGVSTRASAGATTGGTWGHALPRSLASPSTAVVV